MQGCAFWGSEWCAPKFWGKTPKNWILGAWIGLSSLNDKKIQILITWKLLSRSQRNFYREYAPQIRLRGWSHGAPNKSKMAGAAIFNFWKMSVTPDWIKIYVPILMGRCITVMRRCSLTKSRNRKLIRVTSSNEGLKHMCVDLSDYHHRLLRIFIYNRYLYQVGQRTQIPHYQHARMAKLT